MQRLVMGNLLLVLLAACEDPSPPINPVDTIDVHVIVGAVVADGNSFTAPDYNQAREGTDWFSELEGSMAPSAAEWQNFALPSRRTRGMTSSSPTLVDPLLDVGEGHVLIAWEGINDISLGDSGAQAFENLRVYGIARRAAGWKLIVFTILPNPGGNASDRELIERDGFNVILRARWREAADSLVDIASDSLLGSLDPVRRATYYHADKLHLTAAGHARVAAVARGALEQWLRRDVAAARGLAP